MIGIGSSEDGDEFVGEVMDARETDGVAEVGE